MWHVLPVQQSRPQGAKTEEIVVRVPGSEALARAAALFADLPWLLDDLVAGRKEPPNPTDGPTLCVTRAHLGPRSDFKVYLAVSVAVDGGSTFTYVARTPPAAGPAAEWCAALRLGDLGELGLASGGRARLKLPLPEEHAPGGAPTAPLGACPHARSGAPPPGPTLQAPPRGPARRACLS